MSESERWKARIAALLRKAESTRSEHERDALLGKAEELMARWGFERAEIEAREQAEGRKLTVVHETLSFGDVRGETRTSFIGLCNAVFQGLGGLRTIRMPNAQFRGQWDLQVWGVESDVEAAMFLANSILVQAQTGALQQWRERQRELDERFAWAKEADPEVWKHRYNKSERSKSKTSYMIGFGHAVYDRLRKRRENLVQESGTGMELVLVDRSKLVDDAYEQMYPNRTKGRTRNPRDYRAYSRGTAEGERADIGNTRIGNNTKGIQR